MPTAPLRLGQIQDALKFAERALDIMLQLGITPGLPQCYLNMGSLLSAGGLHAQALRHAFLSLQTVRALMEQHARAELPDTAFQTMTALHAPQDPPLLLTAGPSVGPGPAARPLGPLRVPSHRTLGARDVSGRAAAVAAERQPPQARGVGAPPARQQVCCRARMDRECGPRVALH